jgi:hypothetical protein
LRELRRQDLPEELELSSEPMMLMAPPLAQA